MIERKKIKKSLPPFISERLITFQEGLGLNYLTLLSRTISIMLEQNTRQQILISKPDIIVQVPMCRYGIFDFDKTAQISLIGMNKMREALTEYEQSHSSFWNKIKFLSNRL